MKRLTDLLSEWYDSPDATKLSDYAKGVPHVSTPEGDDHRDSKEMDNTYNYYDLHDHFKAARGPRTTSHAAHVERYYLGSRQVNHHLVSAAQAGDDYDSHPLHDNGDAKNFTPSELHKHIETMDEVTKAVALPEGHHEVFTGVGAHHNLLALRKKHGDTLHFPAFTSTSFSPETATRFSKKVSEYRGNMYQKSLPEMIHLHIDASKTPHAGDHIGDQHGDEHEFILRRGAIMKFHGEPHVVEHQGRRYLIHKASLEGFHTHGQPLNEWSDYPGVETLKGHINDEIGNIQQHPETRESEQWESDRRHDSRNLDAPLTHHYSQKDENGQFERSYSSLKGDHVPNLHGATPEETAHVTRYTRDSSALNKALIGEHVHGEQIRPDTIIGSAHHSQITHIDSALSKAPEAPHDFKVWSSVGSGFNIHDLRKEGHEHVHLPAYTSTTTDANRIWAFGGTKVSKNRGKFGPHAYQEVLEIHIPKGSKHGSYIAGQSYFASEHEFLLKRKTTLRFKGDPKIVRKTNGTNLMIHHAEIVPHEEDK